MIKKFETIFFLNFFIIFSIFFHIYIELNYSSAKFYAKKSHGIYQNLSEKEKKKQREYGYKWYKNLLENEKQMLVDDRKTIIKGENTPCYLVRKFDFFLGFSYNQWQNIMGILKFFPLYNIANL